MKFKKYISIILSAALIFVCMPFSVQAETIPGDAEYVEGEIMIVSTKEIEDSHGDLKTASCSDVIDIDFEDAGIEKIEQLEECTPAEEKVYVAEVDGDIGDICKELNKNEDIIAEPNYIYRTDAFMLPRDLARTGGVYEINQKPYFDTILHVPAAWQEHEVTGEGITVAILDNGFFYTGVDAPRNLWKDANGNVGYNAINTSSHDIGPVMNPNGEKIDDSAHGSNVAGIIGMAADGANGIGVAYNAELMLIKVGYYASGETTSSLSADAVYRGIQFARNNGADIINMSFGSTSLSNSIKLAIEGAYADGIAVIASAGNSGSANAYYPAAYSCVIGVMATDNWENPSQLANFSNYEVGNGYYNIAAPGCIIVGCNYISTNLSVLSGTSQASPIVAGCAALYKSLHPDYSADEIYEALIESSTDRVASNPERTSAVYHYPSLDAQKLMNYVHTDPVPEPQLVINTETTASPHDGYLYGLDEGLADIGHYISIADGTGSMTFTPCENGNGTGSAINIYDNNGTLRRTLTVIIFGDINGDSFINGEDAVILKAYNSRLTELTAAQIFAADVNFDNQATVVDEPFVSMGETYYLPSDFTIISQYAIGDNFISQVK